MRRDKVRTDLKILHETKNASELIKMRGKINLNPAWQRGPVWSDSKRSLLIDSILRGYDVPMIYLRDRPADVNYRYEVVDGQQRLRALWDFVEDGGYTLTSDLEQIGDYELAGKKYGDLPKALKTKLLNFKMVVAFVKGAGEPEISRLFSRMQMGVRLNPAELRNAVQTPLRHAIDATALLHPFFTNSQISSVRFKHQDYLAHAISLCIHNGLRDVKAPQLMDDYNQIIDNDEYVPIMADADEILTFLEKVNGRCSKRIKQKWIFVDLFYLLFKYNHKLKKIDVKAFTDTYLKFDQERLEYNAEPKELLKGKPSQNQRDLYDYISAFKIAGGEKSNILTRNKVLNKRFEKILR